MQNRYSIQLFDYFISLQYRIKILCVSIVYKLYTQIFQNIISMTKKLSIHSTIIVDVSLW